MSPVIDLSNVSKRFDPGDVAVDTVSLEVGKGEFVSLLGPSGCGKSTLLRIIAGLDQETSGSIDRDPAIMRRGGTGLVFQNAVLMLWATVFDNVWMPLRLAGQSREAARGTVDAMLAIVGLSDDADLFPRQLSGGMQMRVAIARALITKPDLLLLDEPFAALDEITRNDLNTELLRLQAEAGFTTIFVTHSVPESVFLSDRILIMANNPGRVFGTTEINHDGLRDAGFRSSQRFAEISGEVSGILRQAMQIEHS